MVCSAWKHAAGLATKPGQGVASLAEHNDYLGGFGLVHTDTTNARILRWESAA